MSNTELMNETQAQLDEAHQRCQRMDLPFSFFWRRVSTAPEERNWAPSPEEEHAVETLLDILYEGEELDVLTSNLDSVYVACSLKANLNHRFQSPVTDPTDELALSAHTALARLGHQLFSLLEESRSPSARQHNPFNRNVIIKIFNLLKDAELEYIATVTYLHTLRDQLPTLRGRPEDIQLGDDDYLLMRIIHSTQRATKKAIELGGWHGNPVRQLAKLQKLELIKAGSRGPRSRGYTITEKGMKYRDRWASDGSTEHQPINTSQL